MTEQQQHREGHHAQQRLPQHNQRQQQEPFCRVQLPKELLFQPLLPAAAAAALGSPEDNPELSLADAAAKAVEAWIDPASAAAATAPTAAAAAAAGENDEREEAVNEAEQLNDMGESAGKFFSC